MLKLVGTPTSPFTRKARVVLLEKRIEFEFVVDAPGSDSTRVPELNPLGKVPVLVIDEGNTLFDSRVIVEYLDSASPVQRLIPEETRPRIQVRQFYHNVLRFLRGDSEFDALLDSSVRQQYYNYIRFLQDRDELVPCERGKSARDCPRIVRRVP